MMRVAIDASNIRAGGGVTHLVECLGAYEPAQHDIGRVVVFGGAETLSRLPVRSWLDKKVPEHLKRGALSRFWWRQWSLTDDVARSADILLVPGGSYLKSFRPFVAMVQNLLPFDDFERSREGITSKRLRLHLLESMQSRTFRQANGVIFMTEISRSHIEHRIGFHPKHARVVHHGTNPRFFRPRRPQNPRESFTDAAPFRLLYVSILEPYKHQDIVVEAVVSLRRGGVPVALDLVGPGSPQDQAVLAAQLQRLDPRGAVVRYRGAIPYAELSRAYAAADAFVFASSCETFGIILLEAMAGGLPIVCSHRSAMPEVVGTAATFFDPLHAASLATAIKRLVDDEGLRRNLSFQAQEQARLFTWEKCANETFGFVREIYDLYCSGRTATS